MLRLLALCAAPLLAQTYYPFNIDQDRVAGAPDFSFLNQPITAADRVFVRNGRFFRVGPDLTPNTEDDSRVRFFAMNFAFGANFPEAKDAARIAKRMRRLGVNMIRLHHMDSQPDAQPNTANSILTQGPFPSINAVAAARLRAFLDACKAEGVYVDLNLHVGYVYRAGIDGVPANAPSQSKGLHILYPKMVELEQQFARAVISVLRLEDDPVLAVVEINNEDSLFHSWQSGSFETQFAGVYGTEMAQQWNRHLRARYPNTPSLREAWGATGPDGPQVLASSGWQLELHNPSRATLRAGDEIAVNVEQGGNWAYAKLVGFSISTGQPYAAEVEMRADLPAGQSRAVMWDIKEDVSPWRGVSNKSVSVTSQWQKFTMGFEPTVAMNRVGRFALDVQALAGTTVYIRNWTLKAGGAPGAGRSGVARIRQRRASAAGRRGDAASH